MHYILDINEEGPFRNFSWLNISDCDFVSRSKKNWKCKGEVVLFSLSDIKNELPDFFSCGALFLVSNRLMNIIQSFNSECQFLKAKIKCGVNYISYNVMNVKTVLDVVDKTKSVFIENEFGHMAGITKLKLYEGIKEDLFYLEATDFPILVTSSKLKEELVKENITGTKFIDIELYEEDTDFW